MSLSYWIFASLRECFKILCNHMRKKSCKKRSNSFKADLLMQKAFSSKIWYDSIEADVKAT